MKQLGKKLFGLLLINVVLVAMSSLSIVNAAESNNPYIDALPKWEKTLTQFVDQQGRIDFKALAKQTEDLQVFIGAIESVSPSSHPELFPERSDVLAYHVNAYNALAMWGVIERDIPKNFSTLLKRASFFKFRDVVIGGKKTNLYDYENKVIRPLDEARLHFALNCMVRDCPRLPTKAFKAETLDQDFQRLSKEFFSKEKHIRVEHDSRQLYLSGILKFYTKDYVPSGKKQDLVGYVNQFRDVQIPESYKVKFIKYDWTVNQQPAS